ncbi:hypothetical protein, partial [Niastella populi]|uniref:hypothetical protein n=1 Tax=Niastella populi TaxID=550983 RepID=UPI0010542F9C
MVSATIIVVFYIIHKIFTVSQFIDNFPEKLTEKTLGRLEGRIRNLRQVIVVADKIEDPQNDLREAMKKNFGNNVKYT